MKTSGLLVCCCLIVMACSLMYIDSYTAFQLESYQNIFDDLWIGSNETKRILETNSLTGSGTLSRIKEYNFSASIDKYITDLFPSDEKPLPDTPIFVTGFSSNHFREGLAFLRNFHSFARVDYPEAPLIVYDIGLTSKEQNEIRRVCKCEVRRFPFSKFPKHVRILNGYSWKPIIIQLVAKEHGFVLWMDTSFRFLTNNISQQINMTKQEGVMLANGADKYTVARVTDESMFLFLNENVTFFSDKMVLQAGFVCYYAKKPVVEYFMKPWVSCALSLGCMLPDLEPYKYIPLKENLLLHACHRFDLSMASLLLHRLFGREFSSHIMRMETGLYSFCRGCLV